MTQLCSHLPVQSRHLFLLCLPHPVITFRLPFIINFEGIHPVPLRPGSSLSHYLRIFMSYLSLPHRATRLPDSRCPRVLAIRSTRSHHSHSSRTYLWPRLTPWFLVQLQLYMVSIARPFPAFMRRGSLLMCFRVRLALLLLLTMRLFRSNTYNIIAIRLPHNTLPLAT